VALLPRSRYRNAQTSHSRSLSKNKKIARLGSEGPIPGDGLRHGPALNLSSIPQKHFPPGSEFVVHPKNGPAPLYGRRQSAQYLAGCFQSRLGVFPRPPVPLRRQFEVPPHTAWQQILLKKKIVIPAVVILPRTMRLKSIFFFCGPGEWSIVSRCVVPEVSVTF